MKIIKTVLLFLLLGFIVLFCLFSSEVSETFVNTAVICIKNITPSLLPVIFVSLIIINSNLTEVLPSKIRLLGVFVLSCVSGYPVGAKLLDTYCEKGYIKKETASVLLPSFINAGPGFIINIIGFGILNSKTIGIALFVSQFLASFLIFLALGGFSYLISEKYNVIKFSDIIQKSAYESVSSIRNICTYLILINCFSKVIELLLGAKVATIIIDISEITSAVLKQNNVFAISILLSFCGICIYLQVFSMVKNFKIKIVKLLLCRTLHVILSLSFLKIIFKIFNISTPVFSNITSAVFPKQNQGIYFSIFLIFTFVCCILSIKRKSSGNLLKDLI